MPGRIRCSGQGAQLSSPAPREPPGLPGRPRRALCSLQLLRVCSRRGAAVNIPRRVRGAPALQAAGAGPGGACERRPGAWGRCPGLGGLSMGDVPSQGAACAFAKLAALANKLPCSCMRQTVSVQAPFSAVCCRTGRRSLHHIAPTGGSCFAGNTWCSQPSRRDQQPDTVTNTLSPCRSAAAAAGPGQTRLHRSRLTKGPGTQKRLL